jgi:hypothetical protein
MEYSSIELNDLPDEILLIIMKKLHNVEVLNSFMGVNKRFNRIAHDRTFTSHLSLMKRSWHCIIYNSLPDVVLDRFCSQILPEINHQINWLDLELTSIDRILRATNYPNLYEIGLYGIDIERALSVFLGKVFSSTHYLSLENNFVFHPCLPMIV